MSRPRPQNRSGKPKPRGGGLGWWRRLRAFATLPGPGRLAILGGLVALAVGTLVLLATVSAGGLNRFGLQRLAADIPGAAGAPAKSGYLSR